MIFATSGRTSLTADTVEEVAKSMMKRVLFAATGAHGHVLPLLPLAVAARDAGHEVVFATSEGMFDLVRKAGLEPIKAGLAPAEAFALATDHRPDAVPPAEVPVVIAKVFGDVQPRRVFADLTAHLDRHPADLVVFEIANPGAGLAAEKMGVPAVRHTIGRVVTGPISAPIKAMTNAVAAELGLTRPDIPVVDICPTSLQEADFLADADRIPMRPSTWSEPGDELPAAVRDRDGTRPLVYLTLSTTEAFDVTALRATIDGIATLPVDLLVSTGNAVDPAALDGLPDNVHVQAWVPQHLVLPHVDLIVHHAGAGTALNAFSAGVPQLVLHNPWVDEQRIADTVVAAGVGDRIAQHEIAADAVAEAVGRLLDDPSARAAAGKVAAEVDGMPSPAEVLTRLLAVTG